MTTENRQEKAPRTFLLGSRYHVVVAGCNFAGLKAASALPDDFKVTVIDPGDSFEFLPNIHELLSGVKKPQNLRLPRKNLIHGFGHRFVQDFVEQIDPVKKRVLTAGGKRFYYDFCIVAVGGVNNTFGVEGAGINAMSFKSVEDCRQIGLALENAASAGGEVSAAVVGGGLEGVEALGEILRKYRKVPGFSVELIEKSERLLPKSVPSLDREIRRLCENLNVNFLTSESVESVGADSVSLVSGETIRADVIVWTGGATAPPLLEKSGLSPGEGRWAPVRASCQSENYDDIFVVGDAADLPVPLIKQAYYAMDLGVLSAGNIQRMANGDDPLDFKHYSRPAVVTFGDLATFMIADRFAVAGSALSGVKESIFQLTMARLDRPTRLGAYFDAFGRVKSGAGGFVLPTLMSFSAMKRLGKAKLLV